MITVASVVFLFIFVALGARPYRIAERPPAVEEVAPMPATVYVGNPSADDPAPSAFVSDNQTLYVAGSGGFVSSPCVTMDGASSYFALALKREAQRQRDQRTATEDILTRQRKEMDRLHQELCRPKPNPPCPVCHHTLRKPDHSDYYCDHCQKFISTNFFVNA